MNSFTHTVDCLKHNKVQFSSLINKVLSRTGQLTDNALKQKIETF